MNIPDKGRVLIVEHDPSILCSYRNRLSEAGFKVAQASEATEALHQIENGQFDVLISDFELPEMDGLSLLRHVREHSANLQLVLILDSTNNQLALKAAELGVLQSLVKPIKPEILEKAAALAVRINRKRTNPGTAHVSTSTRGKSAHFTATEAKNEFGRLLEKAIRGDVVVITKHDAPKAVLMSVDEFNVLSGAAKSRIDTLSDEFDSLLTRMQGPVAVKSMEAAFHASPERLGKAAIAAARKRG